jgi:probable rRNA maturation factor
MAPELRLSLQQPDGRHRRTLARHRVARWIRAALETPAEITVRIVGEDEGRALNRSYRARDYATNVLTFDYQRAPMVHADLVLCAPVVAREAREQGKTLAAHYAHLLVHGTLHAQGWDHEDARAARRMQVREAEILAVLGFSDPYVT